MLFFQLIDRSLHEDRLRLPSINFLGEKQENLNTKFRASVLGGGTLRKSVCVMHLNVKILNWKSAILWC